MDNFYWRDINHPLFSWVGSFSKIIKSAAPPSFDGETIIISSDYSGDSSKAKYTVFSISVVDIESIKYWELKRRLIRSNHLPNNRKMSFKGLNDIYKKNALIDFLDTASLLKGLSVNIVINKQIRELIQSDSLYEIFTNQGIIKEKWHWGSFDKMAKLAHFISILIAGIAKPKQNIYWYSDEDNMFSNQRFSSDVVKVLAKFCTYYINFELGERGVGTTKLNEADFFEEDLNAIADLSAGALSEFFENVYYLTNNNRLRDFSYMYPKNLTMKTGVILDWIAYSKSQFKKITIVFDKTDTGFKIWRFDIKDDPRYS